MSDRLQEIRSEISNLEAEQEGYIDCDPRRDECGEIVLELQSEERSLLGIVSKHHYRMARKDHVCVACGGSIKAGQFYSGKGARKCLRCLKS